ncbi:hypothetical protein RND81_10G169000 [Saponaria officinalis]|uniref:Uncharacterized protein n=1 Tax=Saponaria officinalis TaxID=3572 RepID=A0AAW1I2X8_SAPOF
MEKEVVKINHHPHTSNAIPNSTSTSLRERHIIGEGLTKSPQSSDFGLHWGKRKRLRCMKTQVKNEPATVTQTTVRVDRRCNNSDGIHLTNGHFNLRQRPASSTQLPARLLRNTDSGSGMKGHNNNNNNINDNINNNINYNNDDYNHNYGSKNQTNGGIRGFGSPDKIEKKGGTHHHNHEIMVINGEGRAASSETKNGSSSGGVSDIVWPPKFMIALTNKEKEEDFMAIKGSKLPQRPKKRAKFIQRTLNLVSPGGWLCDLTLERYEVREKKISKKRPRGLKAMGNYMESDSE